MYFKYDYEEVITPQVFSSELFTRSGHKQHFVENMYPVETRHSHIEKNLQEERDGTLSSSKGLKKTSSKEESRGAPVSYGGFFKTDELPGALCSLFFSETILQGSSLESGGLRTFTSKRKKRSATRDHARE